MASPLIGHLDHISKLMKQADELKELLSKLPSPWPGMAKERDEAVVGANVVFNSLVVYQRLLLNHVGPKEGKE
jgi:hypothetical protein